MQYISSDANVWIDFSTIDRLSFPFRLPYTYLMNIDAIQDELLHPVNLGKTLVGLGLKPTELTTEEFYLAEEYASLYKRLSLYDCVALAIAKVRNIILLTGDGSLRRAAQAENVQTLGTIGILDRLLACGLISKVEFRYCIIELLKHNGREVRLPQEELMSRI